MVYNTEAETLEPITEENCNTEYWDADPDIYKPVSFFDRFIVAITSFVQWLKLFFEYVSAA